ncbi:undecaprenyl-diphosphatase [Neobacillus niacini]|uniref:undecaprenyl-diphosphatase n=1 Tax=Neobacillus niacini TaxID=86668 RepID=UPI00286231AE|nr:undecaprenyl-diphosphatase [Neobacillus niacini]MDR7001868.1 undecaprenyl-diphosphatase [Neobacillus niacini]
MLTHLDYTAFQWVNHLAITDRFLNPFMVLLAEKAEYLFFAGILFYWFYHKEQNRKMVVSACIAACFSLAINMIIGDLYYRTRPFAAHHVVMLISHARNASFPSDHATAAFVIAMSIWLWRKRDGWIWLILASGIAISRVWTGVHYPLDVIAGMVIGVAGATVVHLLAAHLGKFNQFIEFLIGIYEKVESKIINTTLIRKEK